MLTQAIDALLNFVQQRAELIAYGPDFDRFTELDAAVYLKADETNLTNKLPQPDGETVGLTHLPVLEMVAGVVPLPSGWAVKMKALRKRAEAGAGAKPATRVAPPEQPKKWLKGWHEICAAVDMPHDRHREVKALNERFEGPITNSGRGTSPMVGEAELLLWWDSLAAKQQEAANQRQGRKLSAEAQHDYGRDGVAAPEIGGSVKKRRRPKQT